MRRVAFPVGLLLAVLAAPVALGAEQGPTVPVILDGRAIDAPLEPIEGDGSQPTEGDAVMVGEFLLTLGPERILRLRRAPGLLYLVGDDGTETVVAAVASPYPPRPRGEREGAGEGRDPDREEDTDTLAALTAEQAAGLRGVRIVGGGAALSARLARTDAARCAYAITNPGPDTFAALPAGAWTVFVGWDEREGASSDLLWVARLTRLRWLSLGGAPQGAVTDLSPLAGLTRLRRLSVAYRAVRRADVLAALPGLRRLSLETCKGLADVGFARCLPCLEDVDLRGTEVADLTPLSDHVRLWRILASRSQVSRLPGGCLPRLRDVRLLSTPVAPADVEAFRRAYPCCDVAVDRADLLRFAVRCADRLRVRTGGTCHRKPAREETLFETGNRADIDALVGLLAFTDPQETARGLACGCCGDPTLEFLAGGEVRVALGIHHAYALRWPQGPWVGDAHLTGPAAERLARWLADRGADETLSTLVIETWRGEARKRRERRWPALVSPAKLEALRTTPVAPLEVRTRLMEGLRTPAERILLALRILGSGALENDRVTMAASDAIDAEAAEDVLPVARQALGDDEAGRGVVVWLLFGGRGVPAEYRSLVAPAARRALGDPDPVLRAHALRGLARVPGDDLMDVVRGVVEAAVEPRKGPSAPPREWPFVVDAAVDTLLALRDYESLPRMRQYYERRPARERRAFESALLDVQEEDRAK